MQTDIGIDRSFVRACSLHRWCDIALLMLLQASCTTRQFNGLGESTLGPPAVGDRTRPTFYIPNDRTLLLRGDGVPAFIENRSSIFAGWSRYAPGECGVFTSLSFSLVADAGDVLLRGDLAGGRGCDTPRMLRLTLARIDVDGSVSSYRFERVPLLLDIEHLHNPAYAGADSSFIPIGSTAAKSLELSDDDGLCGRISFNPVLKNGSRSAADKVLVTRTSADTWLVQTQPDQLDSATMRVVHHDRAWCESEGRPYHLPIMMVIRVPGLGASKVLTTAQIPRT